MSFNLILVQVACDPLASFMFVALPLELALVILQVSAAGAGAGVNGLAVLVVVMMVVLNVMVHVVVMSFLREALGDVVFEFIHIVPVEKAMSKINIIIIILLGATSLFNSQEILHKNLFFFQMTKHH